MAFGLSPKYIQDLPIDEFTTEQFLVIALEAAKQLDWNIGYTSETGFIAFTKFSMSSFSEEVKIRIEDGNANLKSECTGNQAFDWGKNKKNIERLVETIAELKNSLDAAELSEKYEVLKPSLVSKEQDLLSQPPSSTKEKITGVFSIFKPTEGYFVTPILININIAIFIIMVISGVNFFLPNNEELLKWGANFGPVTLAGQPWRLITNFFLHIGILHLLFNMYALLYIGLLLEPHLGRTRFLAAYFLTGLVASLSSLWWNDFIISAGASGAIFGLYGVFLAMLTTDLIEKSARKALLTSIIVFVGYNLLNGLKPNSGVDNAAHLGGLFSGLFIGVAFLPSLKKPALENLKYGTIGLLTALVIVTSFLAYKAKPNDIGIYDAKMKTFISQESMALEVYKLPRNSPKEKLLSEIKDRGIYYWNENIKLVADLDKLNLPDIIHDRNKTLIHYCDLRIKSYNLMYKVVSEETKIYRDSMEVYNSEIERTIQSLTKK